MFEIQEVDEDKNYAGEGPRTGTWYIKGKHFREFKMEKRGCYGLVRTIIVLICQFNGIRIYFGVVLRSQKSRCSAAATASMAPS